MTTWEYAHQRGRSLAARARDWAAPHARVWGSGLRRTRRLTLPVAGTGCFVAAAFTVSTLAGLVVAGLACFFIEWRAAR